MSDPPTCDAISHSPDLPCSVIPAWETTSPEKRSTVHCLQQQANWVSARWPRPPARSTLVCRAFSSHPTSQCPPFSLTSCISLRKSEGTSTRSVSHLPSLAKGSRLPTGHRSTDAAHSELPAPCRITSHQHSSVMVSPTSTKPPESQTFPHLCGKSLLSLSAVPFSLHADGSC